MKKKSNKSKFDRGRFFLRYFSTDDVVIACEEQFFFKHFSLLFVARTVLSLSRSTQFLCVCAFFFSRSGRKCDHALGNGAWPVLFPFYWLFSGHYELFCFFFTRPIHWAFFPPNFSQFQRSWCDQVGRSSRRCHGNHWWRVPWGTQWSYPASILIGAFSEDVAVWFYEHFTDCVSSLLVMSVACDDHQKGYRCDFRNDSVVGTVLTVRLRAVERDFSPAANLGLWWRRRDGEGIVSTPLTSGEVNGVAQKLDETRARRWIRGYTR